MVDLWIMAPSPARLDRLVQSVSAQPYLRIAGRAPSFPFLRSLMSEGGADLALIELPADMQPATLRDCLFELLDLVPIVVLSPDPQPAIFNRMRRNGAGGLLQLNASSEQIVQAVRSVAA